MPSVEVGGSIKDLLNFYKEEHRIYGTCPHCKRPFRLSEAKLTYGKEPPKDALTRLKKERDDLEEQLADKESEIEELEYDSQQNLENLKTKFDERLDVEAEKRSNKKVKEARKQAIAQSRSTTLGRAIERIAPWFGGFGYNPGDVRSIFEPVDFIVFNGLFQREVTDLVFIEFKTGNSGLTEIQRSIRNAVDKKKVSFETRKMPHWNLKRLLDGGRAARRIPLIELAQRPPAR